MSEQHATDDCHVLKFRRPLKRELTEVLLQTLETDGLQGLPYLLTRPEVEKKKKAGEIQLGVLPDAFGLTKIFYFSNNENGYRVIARTTPLTPGIVKSVIEEYDPKNVHLLGN